jgi:hypothetical protein
VVLIDRTNHHLSAAALSGGDLRQRYRCIAAFLLQTTQNRGTTNPPTFGPGPSNDKGSRAVRDSQLLKLGQKPTDGGIDRLWSFQSGKMPDPG